MFQRNVEQFGSDYSTAPAVTGDDADPICQTNAAVESHFKSVKCSRHSGRLRLRPYQFVAAELQYVNGKVNKTKKEAQADEQATKGYLTEGRGMASQEKTCQVRRSRSDSQADEVIYAVKTLLTRTKLRDNEKQQVEDILIWTFSNFDALQAPRLGQCVCGQSLPRCTAVRRKFVHVLNVTNTHWVCATNAFTDQPNDVYLYNSLPGAISPDTILHVSVINAPTRTIRNESLLLTGQLW